MNHHHYIEHRELLSNMQVISPSNI